MNHNLALIFYNILIMKLYLFSGDNVKRKTKTIKESLNPVWNETLKMWVAHLIWLMEKWEKLITWESLTTLMHIFWDFLKKTIILFEIYRPNWWWLFFLEIKRISYFGSADQLYFSGVLTKTERMFEGSLERQKRQPTKQKIQSAGASEFPWEKTNMNFQEKVEKINDVNL